MYSHILYPTDGSEAAETVIGHVKDLATTYDARVHVLYVVTPDNGDTSFKLKKDDQGNWRTGMFKRKGKPVSTSGMAKGSVDVNEVLRAEGQSYIQAVADEFNEAGCKVKTACNQGKPNEEILNYAEENDIDLITMGTHGRSGVEHAFLGSVTEKVVRKSKTPVLTIRQDE
jgi:nucleotide-binding universal stress UspA family protein